MPKPDPRDRPLPAHVVTPLLTRITEQSLDEDYLVVARRRSAEQGPAPAPSQRRPQLTAAAVVAVFGLLVTMAAVQTSQNADVNDASRETLIGRVRDGRAAADAQSARINDLQDEVITLQQELDDVTTELVATNAKVRRLQLPTGYSVATGPGVRVTVNDAPDGDVTQLVRDEDLALLVDGLWGAGAEAISVNGERLSVLSAIRNVFVAIHVNSRPISPPYVISAIGDTATLQANLLETTHGQQFFDLADQLGFPYTMDNVDNLTLPAAPAPHLRSVQAGTGGRDPRVDDDEEARP